MKILCVRCKEPMKFEGAEGSGDNAATLAFVCQKCGNSIEMLANQKEGELLRSLGIPVAEKKVQHKGMGVFENQEKSQSTLSWAEEAEAKLSNVPPFAREMARAGIERYASEKGYRKVTLEVMADARSAFGM